MLKRQNAAYNARRRAKRKPKTKPRTDGLTIATVNKAVQEHEGQLTNASFALGVSRSTLYKFIMKHSPCVRAWKDCHESLGDAAETKLHELVAQGDVRCVTFLLSTKHRNRGYGVHKDDTPADTNNQVLTVNVIAIPPGQFLSKEEAKLLTVEHIPTPISSE